MKIFISHSSKDSQQAKRFETLFAENNIQSYLDLRDGTLPDLRRSPAITKKIIAEIEQCNVLFAIITQNTYRSWWVPFEIGIARSNFLTIASYSQLESNDLPEFLLDCPILKSNSQCKNYLNKLKDRNLLLGKTAVGLEHQIRDFSVTASRTEDPLNEIFKFENDIISDLKNSKKRYHYDD